MNVPTFTPAEIVESGTAIVSRQRVELPVVTVKGQFWSDTYAVVKSGYRRQCGKCSDFSGTISCYGHVFGGICFACNGSGMTGKAVVNVKTLLARMDRISKKEIARLQHIEDDRPAMEAREIEIRAAIVAKAEVAAHAEAEKRAGMRFAAEVGAKTTVTGVVAVTKWIEAQQYGWSSSMLVVVNGTGEDAGIVVKVFSSAQCLYGLEQGQAIVISGTVKEHDEYQGTKQTVLLRPKVA